MRWRNVKNHKYSPPKKDEIKINYASPLSRFKSFVVDVFMIYTPILYITTYLILDGKDDFLANQIAVFCDTFLFGFILSIFFAKSSQSPGYKAYEIKLLDSKTMKKPSFLRAFWRYFAFLISGASLIGLILCFFRKDKQNLHDLLSRTIVVNV